MLAWNGQVYGLDGHRGRSIASCDLEQAREDLRAGHNDGLVVLSLIEQAIKYHRTANKVAGAIEAALGDVTSSLDAEWALVLVQVSDTFRSALESDRPPYAYLPEHFRRKQERSILVVTQLEGALCFLHLDASLTT